MRSHAKASSAGSASGWNRGAAFCLATITALVLTLTMAPLAQASKGIFNVFGASGLEAGRLSFTFATSTATGTTGSPGGLAVNSSGNGTGADAGDVYVVDRSSNRIQQFSPSGEFIRAWGYDVVRSGEHNSGADERQTVTVPVSVSAGTFTLTVTTGIGEGLTGTLPGRGVDSKRITGVTTSLGGFRVGDRLEPDANTILAVDGDALTLLNNVGPPNEGRRAISARETTAPIAFNAPASGPGSVQAALEALPGVGPGGVTVTGGPGATAPFAVTFSGADFKGNDVPQMIATSSLTGGSASVATSVEGGGIEICSAVSIPKDACKAGTASPLSGAMSAPQGIAVDQATGNLFVTDQGNRRIDVFGPDGTFQGAFGWGVDTGAAAFQFCTIASVCQAPAAAGGAAGQFGTTMGHPAIAPTGAPNAGNLLVADSANNRIDEFSLTHSGETVTGASFVRGFGWDTISGAPTTLESCTTASTCKAGSTGGGAGQFSTGGAARVAVDTSGAIYAVNLPPGAAANTTCSATARCAVQKFNPAATAASEFAPAQLTSTSGGLKKRAVSAIAVDPASGDVYVAKGNEGPSEYRVHRFDSTGALQETSLAGFGVGVIESKDSGNLVDLATANGLAFDTSSGRLLLTSINRSKTHSNEGGQRIFVLEEIPAETGETLSASLGDPPVSAIAGESATVHGIVDPGQGIEGHTRYEFEYSNGSVWQKAPVGDAGNGSGAGDPSECPTANPVSCEVSEELQLESGQTYKVRLHAFIPYNPELSVRTQIVTFEMPGTPPGAETASAWWSSPAETKPSMLMTGFINPENEITSYYFQYVSEGQFAQSGFDAALTAPAPPGDPAAKGFNTVEVQQAAYDLDPSKIYRYRLVALSPAGTSIGAARTLLPPDSDSRFYELVSDADIGGLASYGPFAISDHDRVLFTSQALPGSNSAPTVRGPQIAERTASSWKVTGLAPDADYGFVGGLVSLSIAAGYQPAADLSRILFEGGSLRESGNGPQAQANRGDRYFLANLDQSVVPASPVLQPLTTTASSLGAGIQGASVRGASADLSRYVISVGTETFFSGELPLPRLYSIDSETLEMKTLNVDTGGKLIGGVCGATLGRNFGATNSISLDGSVMYFSARPGVPQGGACDAAVQAEFRTRVFKRENETTTTEVSKSQCNRPALPTPCQEIAGDDLYQGASGDGEVVFFSSPRQLTDSDLDSTEDLYVYDSTPPEGQSTLIQASAGEETAGHPTIGSGAQFVGLVDTASNGSRVYFVAKGQLTPGATSGQNNLYVFERSDAHPAGRIGFIGVLAAGDSGLWTSTVREAHAVPSAQIDDGGEQTYGDGRFLFLNPVAKLSGADTDSVKDLYRYSDESNELICLSCAGNEAQPVETARRGMGFGAQSIAAASQMGRVASADGSAAVFLTEEALLPEDQNGLPDVYGWSEGELSLISVDTGKFGVVKGGGGAPNSPMISPDGASVYFVTEARLVPSNVDENTAPDVYAARLGGGFPAPKPEARICTDGEVCRGETTAAPSSSAPASSLAGPGNPSAAKKARCRKGKVRRKGRCVKSKASKKKQRSRQRRQANRNARGSK